MFLNSGGIFAARFIFYEIQVLKLLPHAGFVKLSSMKPLMSDPSINVSLFGFYLSCLMQEIKL